MTKDIQQDIELYPSPTFIPLLLSPSRTKFCAYGKDCYDLCYSKLILKIKISVCKALLPPLIRIYIEKDKNLIL